MKFEKIGIWSFCAVIVLASAQVWGQSTAGRAVDLKDRDFKPEEIVRALAPREATDGASTSKPARRTRGLGVVQAGVTDVAEVESPRRSVSMQLQFDFDSAQLTYGAMSRLDAVGIALRSPELRTERFLLSGHTDSTGRYDYNIALSKRRADAVRDYLVQKHGVESSRLVPVGKGSDELVDPRDPANAVNRRVQLDALN